MFFELIVARTLQILGGQLEVELPVKETNRRPDFCARFDDETITVEATVPELNRATGKQMEWKGKKLNWNLIGRALYKIGLGMVAFKQGRERACESKFNAAREFIRTGTGVENNLVVRTKFLPHPSIQTLYLEIPEGTPVLLTSSVLLSS